MKLFYLFLLVCGVNSYNPGDNGSSFYLNEYGQLFVSPTTNANDIKWQLLNGAFKEISCNVGDWCFGVGPKGEFYMGIASPPVLGKTKNIVNWHQMPTINYQDKKESFTIVSLSVTPMGGDAYYAIDKNGQAWEGHATGSTGFWMKSMKKWKDTKFIDVAVLADNSIFYVTESGDLVHSLTTGWHRSSRRTEKVIEIASNNSLKRVAACANGKVIAISDEGLWHGMRLGFEDEEKWWKDNHAAGGIDVGCNANQLFYIDHEGNMYTQDGKSGYETKEWHKIPNTKAVRV